MNPHQLKRLFPHASKSVLAANSGDYGTGKPEAVIPVKDPRKAPELELFTGAQSLEADQVQEASSGRVYIRVISVRKRLCDPDNLSEKYLLDALRYARILRDDTAKDIFLETTQKKCRKGEEEHTVLEVYELP